MYAFRQTVEKRSYSRYCGSTSDETERKASGNSSRTISATRASCSGFRNEKRKQTATASTPASFSLRTCSRARSPGQLLDALDRALRRVLGRRRDLVHEHSACVVVDVDQVGEGAADVDAEAFHGLSTIFPKCSRRSIVAIASRASVSGKVL